MVMIQNRTCICYAKDNNCFLYAMGVMIRSFLSYTFQDLNMSLFLMDHEDIQRWWFPSK